MSRSNHRFIKRTGPHYRGLCSSFSIGNTSLSIKMLGGSEHAIRMVDRRICRLFDDCITPRLDWLAIIPCYQLYFLPGLSMSLLWALRSIAVDFKFFNQSLIALSIRNLFPFYSHPVPILRPNMLLKCNKSNLISFPNFQDSVISTQPSRTAIRPTYI